MVAVEDLHELGEGQRPHANLVPAPPEPRHDVMREELRVASRHAHVDVTHAQKPVEHTVEPEPARPTEWLNRGVPEIQRAAYFGHSPEVNRSYYTDLTDISPLAEMLRCPEGTK